MTKSELHLKDPYRAMINQPTIWLRGPTDKSLSDLRFVVKDLFDVAGVPPAGGSPAWLQTSTLPQIHAVIVSELLGAGAELIGTQSLTKFH